MWTCENCGHENRTGAVLCAECGEYQPGMDESDEEFDDEGEYHGE